MSYISVFDCDICGWIVVSLLGRVGVYICMRVGVKKGDSLVLALVLCQFGLVSGICECVRVCVCGCSSPSALAVAQSLLVMHCLKETWGLQMQLNELVSFLGRIYSWLWCCVIFPNSLIGFTKWRSVYFNQNMALMSPMGGEKMWKVARQVKTGHHAWKSRSSLRFLRSNATFCYIWQTAYC